MSTKNFASYGDMETLMTGIKSAIDGAGGGGIEKVVVGEYTNSNTTFNTFGQDLALKLNAITNIDILSKLKLVLHFNVGNSNEHYDVYSIAKAETYNDYYTFYNSDSWSYNNVLIVRKTGVCEWYRNSADNMGGDSTFSARNVNKIECYYSQVEDAVVPSGETVLATIEKPDLTVIDSYLQRLLTILDNVSYDDCAKLYITITVPDSNFTAISKYNFNYMFRQTNNTNNYYFTSAIDKAGHRASCIQISTNSNNTGLYYKPWDYTNSSFTKETSELSSMVIKLIKA